VWQALNKIKTCDLLNKNSDGSNWKPKSDLAKNAIDF
jgi:hypothetical protein